MTLTSKQKVISALSIFVVLVGLISGQLFQVFFLTLKLSSTSMSPGIKPNDWIIAHKGGLPKEKSHKNKIIAFKHPQQPDRIDVKRIIAESGDTIQFDSTRFLINGNPLIQNAQLQTIPDTGIFFVDPKTEPFTYSIPKPGDTLKLESLPLRHFYMAARFIQQEVPDSQWSIRTTLYIDEKPISPQAFRKRTHLDQDIYTQLSTLPWFHQENILRQLRERFPKNNLSLKNELFLKTRSIKSYVVQHPSYFVIGDKRSDSNDSRFFGLVHSNAVLGRPFLIYWSKNTGNSSAIRFHRIFKTVS